MSELDDYKAFRLNADKFYSNVMLQQRFHDVITSNNPDRQEMIVVLAEAGIFPDDEARRGVIADACIALAAPDGPGTSSGWQKLGHLAEALDAPAGPPWG